MRQLINSVSLRRRRRGRSRATASSPPSRTTPTANREWLLVGSQAGRVRYLDLVDGQTGILLEPPGRPAIGRLLCRDRSALGIACNPDIIEEGPSKRAGVIQFWDYAALRRAL